MLFAAGLAAVLLAIYAAGAPFYAPPDKRKVDAVLGGGAPLEAVVVGSSHGVCVDLAQMGLAGANFARNGQDIFEEGFKARALASHLEGRKVMLASISYFSFVYDNAACLEKGRRTRMGRRLEMYAAFPSLDYIDGDRESFLKGLLFPILTEDHWGRVIRFEENGEKETEAPEEAAARSRKRRSAAQLKRHARGRAGEYVPVVTEMLQRHPGLEEDAVADAIDWVRAVRAQGVRVVFFTPPYYEAYTQSFRGEWKRSMYRGKRRLIAATGVEWYDHSADPAFAATPALFRNSDHLNAKGARRFSRVLAEEVPAPFDWPAPPR